jgi:hypothetical protein
MYFADTCGKRAEDVVKTVKTQRLIHASRYSGTLSAASRRRHNSEGYDGRESPLRVKATFRRKGGFFVACRAWLQRNLIALLRMTG